MAVELSSGPPARVDFAPGTRVFEDIAPRLWDVTGDGLPEIVVVETDPPQGAQLSVYGLRQGRITKLAATPHIGRTNRWLAPIAAADLDGDGHIEIAYIDRPHLAKTLRIWRYRDGVLSEVASATGLTNHKIGWDFIAGGLRDCDGTPELITANANWSRIIATRFDGTTTNSRQLSAYTGPDSLTAATACD
ncbi:VCBS repeat-containing protein [Roseovarius faecimaris]|uniref:VCBS repeat-containing protein n=2 Tax=Roseovarius faecimaris TaxID=2494550 RepID=A0A6I6IVU1_9RHOB|nr:VCBS repeat-containing protein [Roseovarius faecimaris]